MSDRGKILESKIKELVIESVFQKKAIMPTIKNDFIIDEFSVANFTRRVDLFYSKNDQFFAFEIKSEVDSLIRLKGQVDEYLTHFDKVTVVTASRHLEKVLQLTPKHVAVWEVSGDRLKVIRRGRISPITDKMKFIKMMTLIELLNLAKKMNIELNDKKRKTVEFSLLGIPIKNLREEAVNNLRVRYKKRGINYYDKDNYVNYGLDSNAEPRKKCMKINNIDSLIRAIEEL